MYIYIYINIWFPHCFLMFDPTGRFQKKAGSLWPRAFGVHSSVAPKSKYSAQVWRSNKKLAQRDAAERVRTSGWQGVEPR